MAIKLVVSDIDGTLIDGTEAIAPELIEALRSAKSMAWCFHLPQVEPKSW